MWIHDLFLDEFFPGREPTLALDDLQPGLNLLHCGSTREAHEFQRQLVDLLANESPTGHARVDSSGTISLRSGECLMEISRIGLRAARGKPQIRTPREVVIAAGDPVLAKGLTERMDGVDARLWRALYTDTDGPLQRIATWWQLGLHEQLAAWPVPEHAASPVGATRVVPPVAPVPPTVPLPSPLPPQHLLPSLRRTDWRHYHQRLLQRLRPRCAPSAPAAPTTTSLDSNSANAASVSAHRRAEYLAAKQRVTDICQQQHVLQRDLDALRSEVDLAEIAHRLLADWQLAQSAQRIIPPEHGAEATADELKLLEKFDRQISQLRRHLQQCRQGLVTRTREVEREHHARCEESIASARELMQSHDRLQAIDPAAALDTEVGDSSDLPWNLERLVPRIRELSHARRSARRRIVSSLSPRETSTDAAAIASTADVAAVADMSSVVDTPRDEPSRRQGLLRQVEQLRAETRRLLARQALSAQALLGVGMLFSSSVAVFLAALLLRLDGAEFATGAIGLIGMVASALLKASFERTPSHRLRQQRLRINALLEEIQQLPSTTRPASSDMATHPAVVAPAPLADAHVSHNDGTPSMAWVAAWEAAEAAWQEFLSELGAAPDTSPRHVLRAMREHNRHCQQEQSRAAAATRNECEQQTIQWIDRACVWCRQHEITNVDSASHVDLRARIASALDHLMAGRTAAGDERLTISAATTTTTATTRHEELQQHLRQAKRRRQRLLERHGVEDANELHQLLGVWEIYRQQLARVEEARANVARVLDNHPQRASLQQFLDTSDSLPRFLERAALRQQELRRTLHALEAELELCKSTLAATTTMRPEITSHSDPLLLPVDSSPIDTGDLRLIGQLILWQLESCEDHAHDEIERLRAAEQIAMSAPMAATAAATEPPPLMSTPSADASADTHVSPEPRRPIPLRPLLRATAWLRSITGDKHLQFVWDADDPIPKLVLADEPSRSLRDLPARWQQVAVLCLQLALAKEHAVRHGALPWLLTDRSLRVPARAAQQLAQRFLELTAGEQQIILLVTRRETAALFDKQSVASLSLAPLARPTIPFDSAPSLEAEAPSLDADPVATPSVDLEEHLVEPSVEVVPQAATFEELAWTDPWLDDRYAESHRATIAMVEVAYERAG